MCSISAIRISVLVWSCVKVLTSLIMIIGGGTLCSDKHLLHAFGFSFSSYGAGILCSGLISLGTIYPQLYANKRHNRFLILCVFALDMIVVLVVFLTALEMKSYMTPQFPKAMQRDCLLNTPQIYTPAQCRPFLESDRTAGFRLLWGALFTTQVNINSYQLLTKLESSECCGFFAPMACTPINGTFPSYMLQKGVASNFLSKRVTCGKVPGFYAETSTCRDSDNINAINPTIVGCFWDLGVGYCTTQALFTYSSGCASRVEDYLIEVLQPYVALYSFTPALNLLMMLYACCMFWKRKEADVFPKKLTLASDLVRLDPFPCASTVFINIFGCLEHVYIAQVDVEFGKVKEQFEVNPEKDLLEKEGFLQGEDEGPRSGGGIQMNAESKVNDAVTERDEFPAVEAAPSSEPA